jgi:hypothetical protein
VIYIRAGTYCCLRRTLTRQHWLLRRIWQEPMLSQRSYHTAPRCRVPIDVACVQDDLIHRRRTSGPLHWEQKSRDTQLETIQLYLQQTPTFYRLTRSESHGEVDVVYSSNSWGLVGRYGRFGATYGLNNDGWRIGNVYRSRVDPCGVKTSLMQCEGSSKHAGGRKTSYWSAIRRRSDS